MTDTEYMGLVTEPAEVALLRGPLSKRATSAEFNEWQAREVVAYIDKLRSALTAPVAEEEPVAFVVDQNGLCLVPDEHVEAVRKLFSGPDIEVNGRKLKKAVRVYAHPLAPTSIGDGVVVPRADLQFCVDAIAHLKEHQARLRLEQLLASAPGGNNGN